MFLLPMQELASEPRPTLPSAQETGGTQSHHSGEEAEAGDLRVAGKTAQSGLGTQLSPGILVANLSVEVSAVDDF